METAIDPNAVGDDTDFDPTTLSAVGDGDASNEHKDGATYQTMMEAAIDPNAVDDDGDVDPVTVSSADATGGGRDDDASNDHKDGATHLLEAIGPAYARNEQFWKAILWSCILQGLLMALVALAFFNFYVFLSKATWLTHEYEHALHTTPTESFWSDVSPIVDVNDTDSVNYNDEEEHGEDPLAPLRLGGGEWCYIALLAGGGFAVGLVKVLWSFIFPKHKFPRKVPGFLIEVRELSAHDVLLPIPILLCSSLSLGFGASVGPEAALGATGTTLGSLILGRRWKWGSVQANSVHGSNDEGSASCLAKWLPDFSTERELCALDGMSAAFGALFPAQYLSGLMIHELGSSAWTEGSSGAWTVHFMETVTRTGLSSSVAYVIFTGLEDRTLLEEIPLPFSFYSLLPTIRAIDMLYALVLGVLSGLLGLVAFILLAVFGAMGNKVHDAFEAAGGKLGISKDILGTIFTPTVGGALLGLLCKAVPLVIGDGADQLGPLITLAEDLGLGVIVAAGFCKLIAVSLSVGFGFVSGPIFPLIFAGTCLGVASHMIVPDVPAVVAISSCMVAVGKYTK